MKRRAIKRRAILCLALGAAGFLVAPAAVAGILQWDSYAVKFICGAVVRGPFEDAVDGKYKTTVNIHNPHYLVFDDDPPIPLPVVFLKKIVLAPHQDEQPLPHSCFILEVLSADESRSVNCGNIKAQLALSGLPSTGPLDGYVVLLVPPAQDPSGSLDPPELDVSGVYSARSRVNFVDIQKNGAAGFDVEDVGPRQVRGEPPPIVFCD